MTKILVAVDGSDASRRAAQLGLELTGGLGAELHFMTVVRNKKIDEIESGGDHWSISGADRAEVKLREFILELDPQVKYGIISLSGKASEMIPAEAKRLGADILVLGNKRMQSIKRVLGSVAQDILREPPCNVLLAK